LATPPLRTYFSSIIRLFWKPPDIILLKRNLNFS
jgi:hypothetical protein